MCNKLEQHVKYRTGGCICWNMSADCWVSWTVQSSSPSCNSSCASTPTIASGFTTQAGLLPSHQKFLTGITGFRCITAMRTATQCPIGVEEVASFGCRTVVQTDRTSAATTSLSARAVLPGRITRTKWPLLKCGRGQNMTKHCTELEGIYMNVQEPASHHKNIKKKG